MIPLASIEGKLVFMVVAAAVGAINWWLEKRKKDSQPDSQQPPAPLQKTVSSGDGDTAEQERLRRFLEVLGVPQPQPPQQRQPRPQSPPASQRMRPMPAQATLPHPVQRQVTQRIEGRMQGAKSLQKTPQKVTRRKAPPVAAIPEEMHRAGRIEEAATSIERISGEFETMNVRVDMPTMEMPKTTANAGTTRVLERDANPLVASLRRTLTNPTDIRAAFLAAELLGPPKALQG